LVDASAAFAEVDREYLVDRGVGITSLAARGTCGPTSWDAMSW
jgi:hypothetical protein